MLIPTLTRAARLALTAGLIVVLALLFAPLLGWASLAALVDDLSASLGEAFPTH